ncbi:hypothetical protein SAMN05428953_111147 [Mesorhizobium muleiense]|uniref:Uncharacterized protein n=1 Tax=Mesorhizobium muleiense TaxID=1004279 RepID=A0A1G8Z1Z0_9HYPH|nr:hypothetical protein SAMN05428953_111147 [Mesorhizobium muleiense]
MRVEHHLLRLARIGPHEEHAAVAEPHVRDLHCHRHAVEQDDLVTPVELVGLARCKTQRNVGLGHGAAAFRRPALSMPPPRTVAAVIAEAAKLLENTDQRQPLPLRLGRIRRQQPVQRLTPSSHAGIGLVLALVAELRLLRTQDLAHHLARDLQLTADRFDRLPLDQRQPTYLCNRLQNQHPKHKRLRSNRRHLDDPIVKGSRLDENHPLNRVLIHEKSMHYLPKLREIATDRFEGAFGGLVSEVVA